MPSTGPKGGAACGLGVVELLHAPVAGELGGDDREVLLAAPRRLRLLHRVAEAELQRPQRPRRALVGARRRRLGEQLELDDRGGALADRVAHAVGAGVAAADDDDVLVLGADRRVLGSGHPAVAHVEVVHGEVHAVELAARHRQVARHARADGQDHGVMGVAQLLGADVDADVDAQAQLDALGHELLHAALDDRLLDLEVGHAEAHEAAGRLVALVEHHGMPGAAQLLRRGHARRPGADDRHAAPALATRGHRDDPAGVPRVVDDRVLDLLDRHRVALADLQHAGGLARRRAQAAGELREVVGGVQLADGVLPAVAVDEVVPVGDQVAQRAAVVAEGHAAVHAAPALRGELVVGALDDELLVGVLAADALDRVVVWDPDALDLQEAAHLAHQAAISCSEPAACSASTRL